MSYGITSVPRELEDADTLFAWDRGLWGIENRSHYVRDVSMGEDASRIHTGHAPRLLAGLRNGGTTALRVNGVKNIAAALRTSAYQGAGQSHVALIMTILAC